MFDDDWSRECLIHFETAPDEQSFYQVPDLITKSGNRFYKELNRSLEVLVLITEGAVFSDNARHVAIKALNGEDNLPRNFNPRVPLPGSSGLFRNRLIDLSPVLSEMIFARFADNFVCYLSSIVRECLVARPEILRSGESLTYEVALRCETIQELRDIIADKKIDDLAYLGLNDLSKWIAEKLGVNDLTTIECHRALIEIMEIRNCIVHNRGMMSAKLVRILRYDQNKIGHTLGVDLDFLTISAIATALAVCKIDNSLAQKFNLSRSTVNDTISKAESVSL